MMAVKFSQMILLKQVAPLNRFNTSSLFSQTSPNSLTKNTHTNSGVIKYVKQYCILKPDSYFWTQRLLLWSLNASLAHLLFVVVVESLSRVWLFGTPWTAACQTPLPSTVSQSLLRFMPTESVMLYNHLILCWPILLLPSIFPDLFLL